MASRQAAVRGTGRTDTLSLPGQQATEQAKGQQTDGISQCVDALDTRENVYALVGTTNRPQGQNWRYEMEHICDTMTGLEIRQRALVARALATGFWERMIRFEGDDPGDVTSFTDGDGRAVILIAQDDVDSPAVFAYYDDKGELLVTGVHDGPNDERIALWTDLLEARFEQISDTYAGTVVFKIPYA